MKVNKQNQSGVAALEFALLLVIVAIIGFAGYKIYQTRQSLDQQSSAQTSTPTPKSAEGTINPDTVPAINSSSDLNKAEQSLNGVNTSDDSSDLSQLSSQSNGF